MSPAPAPSPARSRSFESAAHHAFVRERLRCLGVAAADLDDATQDVFEILVRRIADYDPERPIRAWMAGMARRVARRYRDRGRRSVVPLDERASGERSPEELAAAAEARAVLQRFLAELEPERWTVFVLSEIEGLRGSEIAAELGVNQNTVYARLRSARQAFERTLKRQRARERRGLWAIVIWPRRWSFGSKVALVGSLGLGATTTLALGGTSCGGSTKNEMAQPSHAAARSQTKTARSPVGVAARPADPARPRARSKGPDGWDSGGWGTTSGSNAKGEPYTLSTEHRYRLDGDRVIVELTFTGDEVAIDSVSRTLTPKNLELVEGELEWELALAPDEVATRTTTLRATREGVVELRIGSERGSAGHKWVHEGGRLRRCEGSECDAPVADNEQLSGERIRIHLHNECEVPREFVLFAGYPELLPPESVPVYSLQPDEQRTMEIDAAQWIIGRDPDGSFHGGANTDEDGGRVTFSGSGESCSAISATSPNLPPGHPAAEPPSRRAREPLRLREPVRA